MYTHEAFKTETEVEQFLEQNHDKIEVVSVVFKTVELEVPQHHAPIRGCYIVFYRRKTA